MEFEIISQRRLMEEFKIRDNRTIHKMMKDGQLPPFSFGGSNNKSNTRGWLISELKPYFKGRELKHS